MRESAACPFGSAARPDGRGRQLGVPSPLHQREGPAADRGHELLARMAALMPARAATHLSRQDPWRHCTLQSPVWSNEREGRSCWSGRCCLGYNAASASAAKERRQAMATRGRSGRGPPARGCAPKAKGIRRCSWNGVHRDQEVSYENVILPHEAELRGGETLRAACE